MPIYHASVMYEAEVHTDAPLTTEQVRAMVQPTDAIELVLTEIEISVRVPTCADAGHLRNSITDQPHRCDWPEDEPVHRLTPGQCAAARGICPRPADHHAYVSPGWDAPSA